MGQALLRFFLRSFPLSSAPLLLTSCSLGSQMGLVCVGPSVGRNHYTTRGSDKQVLRITYTLIHAWSHPPSFPCTSHWGVHVLHHDGGKFLLATPPATFPLTGSLKLDPVAIQRLAPMTTHQESQFGYLAPIVSS